MKVFIALEYHYDWYEFERYIGVFHTQDDAIKFIREENGNDWPIVHTLLAHEVLASEEKIHYWVFQDGIQ